MVITDLLMFWYNYLLKYGVNYGQSMMRKEVH